MQYLVMRNFNTYTINTVLDEALVKKSWIDSGLVIAIEPKEKFMEMVDESIENLDPEKPKRKRG